MRPRTRQLLIALLLSIILASSGCSFSAGARDAGGLTARDAAAMSTREHFELFRERYERVHELLAETQRLVSDGDWGWGGEAFGPSAGTFSDRPLPGATVNPENSYFLDTLRAIRVGEGTWKRSDADPVLGLFEERGWNPAVFEKAPGSFRIRARTEDGYALEYTVQPNGQINVAVTSGAFWGPRQDLLFAVVERIPFETILRESPPGVYVKFPEWEDPVLRVGGAGGGA